MSRHFDKSIADYQRATAEIGRAPERTERRTRAEIESFVKGFGLSRAATRQLVAEWDADGSRAYHAGYEEGIDYGRSVGY